MLMDRISFRGMLWRVKLGWNSWYSRKMHWEAGGTGAPLYGGLLLVPCFLCFTHQISSSHLMLLWCGGHSLILYHIPHFIVWEHFSQKINIALKKFFYWSVVDLQCCFFCCIARWISYTYIHPLLDSFPIEVIIRYWVDFSVLYGRSSLAIYFTHCVVVVVQLLSCVRLFATHGLQHSRFSCPLLFPGVGSNSCPLSWWCYLTISSSATLFSFCFQSFSASGSFSTSRLFTIRWPKY